MTTQISTLPTPPSRTAPVLFSARTDALLGALPGFVTQANALAVEAGNNAVTAANGAATASTKADEALASANAASLASTATGWISGTTYSAGEVVWSQINKLSYRRIANGAGTVDPSLDPGTWVELVPSIPAGTIVPWMGGYFTALANGGFTSVLGNTVAAVNARLNVTGWYVCDGTLLNLDSSPIFNGTGRYLPNLSDSRFIMGNTVAGGIGGSNSSAHTHSLSGHSHTQAHTHGMKNHVHYYNHCHPTGDFTLGSAYIPSHNHTNAYLVKSMANGADSVASVTNTGFGSGVCEGGYYGNSLAHNHGTTSLAQGGNWSYTYGPNDNTTDGVSTASTGTPSSDVSGAASSTENRPTFLSCFYIIKVR